jgi:hypothetical protein
VHGLLLAGQAEATQGAPEGRQRAAEAASLVQLLEGGIGVLEDQSGQSSPGGKVEGPLASSTMSFGGQRARLTPPLNQSGHARDTDAKPFGDLSLGATFIEGRRHSLSEVHGVGCHDSLLWSQYLWLQNLVFPS